jgi:hypothetical protein
MFGETIPLTPPAFTMQPERGLLSRKQIGGIAASLVFVVATWITRDQWIPRPALELHLAETNGSFSVEWNRAAVRGLSHGLILLSDGATSKRFELNRTQLEAGAFAYARQSPQVEASLEAGSARATAKFVAPPVPASPALPH